MSEDNETESDAHSGTESELEEQLSIELPLADRQRHDTLWYEDGTIILSSKTTLFRVYRETLASQSVLFKDMFSLPVVSGVNEMYDGVPLVRTSDEASGLEAILGILYHTKCVTFHVV